MSCLTLARRRDRGITLIEHVVGLAIVTAAVGLAGSGLGALQQSQRLASAAAAVETDLQFARSLSVARAEFVRIGFHHDGQQSCYVVYSGPAGGCDCADPQRPRCSGDAQLLRHAPIDPSLSLQLRGSGTGFGFDGRLGTASPTATIELRNSAAQTLRLVVNLMGRVRSCSPDGSVAQEARC